MPRDPFEQGRRFGVRADRHGRALAQAAAGSFQMTLRHSDLLVEQRLRLAEGLHLRGGWTVSNGRGGPRRKPGREPDAGGVPATPDRPKNLSGGAAAAMEFEDD